MYTTRKFAHRAADCARLLCLLALTGGAAAAEDVAVPAPLAPWVDWALHGSEQLQCPPIAGKQDQRRCAWPGQLLISTDTGGARLRQSWTLLADSTIALPGQAGLWPQTVLANDEPVAVVALEGVPVVRLPRGQHELRAEYRFSAAPDSIQLPEVVGLVALSINGDASAQPDIDRGGRLWLKRRGVQEEATDTATASVGIELFSRIDDSVPLRLTQRLELDVSGPARELVLPALVPADFVPLALNSPLPAQLEADGGLRLQVRPGQHSIELVLRSRGPIESLERLPLPEPLPDTGLLSFAARPSLRTVTVEGLLAVDPRQTRLPQAWHELPTYRFATGDSVRLVERQRGDSGAEPDALRLSRHIWMDFSGAGYTVRDTLGGELRSGWRLDAGDGLAIGRVTVDGQPRLVTRLATNAPDGVELRRGPLALVAESRVEGALSDLPAVGWRTDVQALDATVVLPPGWRLLLARGVDQVSNSWITRWTLLDLFIVLIGAAAAVRLWGWGTGLLALLVLALSFHEAGAPRWVWLHVVAAVALLRVLPAGKLRTLVSVYRAGALVALLVVAVPFAARQVSLAAFPQRERASAETRYGRSQPAAIAAQAPAAPAVLLESMPEADEAPERSRSSVRKLNVPTPLQRPLQAYDPSARLQTGPGLPAWSWNRVQLGWSGPVGADESVQFVFLPPMIVSMLRALAVLLLGVLVLRVVDLRSKRTAPAGAGTVATAGVAMLAAVGLGTLALLASPAAQAQAIPSEAMLETLRERLLAPPECAPECATSPGLAIEVNDNALRLAFDVHTQANVAVPLPGASLRWQPDSVRLNGEPASDVLRDRNGRLLLRLEAGVHQVLLTGRLPALASLPLPLPLRPQRVTVRTSEGLVVRGLRARGQVGDQLLIERTTEPAQSTETELGKPALPPFLQVTRSFELSLAWRVVTQVRRLSAADGPAVVAVPLFAGESVLSEGVEVRDGEVLVNLAPGQNELSWTSSLPVENNIELLAAERAAMIEVWNLRAVPVWHVEREGIAPVFAQRDGRSVQWRPWPGEQVKLSVTRPAAAPGPTLTAQKVALTVRPGSRASTTQLRVDLLTSQGAEHGIAIPEDAELGRVRVDGRELPARRENGRIIVPLVPGARRVELEWREPRGMNAMHYATQRVDVGVDAVNTSVEVEVPENRWVLWARGPLLGPAVLFWGMLVVLVVLSPVLALGKRTPLGFVSWFLLGVGLTQVPVWAAIVVAAWLFALGVRGRAEVSTVSAWRFDLVQLALAALTLAALAVICWAIGAGLLGSPEMQIGGNGSFAGKLRWFVDRGDAVLPMVEVFSVPLLAYRIAMLVWALWVAAALVRWLAWGWRQFTTGGYWRALRFSSARKPRGPAPSATPKAEPAS